MDGTEPTCLFFSHRSCRVYRLVYRPTPEGSKSRNENSTFLSQVMRHTPPSLFVLFGNFDNCMHLGRPPQGGTGGGLLVGMSIRGLPLAEPPVLELYGPTQSLYSSTDEEEENVVCVPFVVCAWIVVNVSRTAFAVRLVGGMILRHPSPYTELQYVVRRNGVDTNAAARVQSKTLGYQVPIMVVHCLEPSVCLAVVRPPIEPPSCSCLNSPSPSFALAASVMMLLRCAVLSRVSEMQLWNGDQGFFKVNCALSGDFVVIARFKGKSGVVASGPEGVLFRYCNHTCFLPVGDQVDLSKSKVRCARLFIAAVW